MIFYLHMSKKSSTFADAKVFKHGKECSDSDSGGVR